MLVVVLCYSECMVTVTIQPGKGWERDLLLTGKGTGRKSREERKTKR
jgi:hypothetical protein